MTDVTQSPAAVLDTPAQISSWEYLSAVSQLASEIETRTNWYGNVSVLKGIQRKGWAPAGNATRRNKILALAGLLYEQPSGHVIDRARKVLDKALVEAGWVITMADAEQ